MPVRNTPAAAATRCPLPRCACFGVRRPLSAISTHDSRISAGTIASKTLLGSVSSRMPPVNAPVAVKHENTATRRRCPASSRRYPTIPLMPPNTSPTVFDTFSATGGGPTASSVGNVTSDPDPTIVLTMPAAPPAAKTATYSPSVTRARLCGAAVGVQRQQRRDPEREGERAVGEEVRRVLERAVERVADADQRRRPGRGAEQAPGQKAAQPQAGRPGGEG